MSKYEKYKPSDIDWIGEIPEHWYVKSFKNLLISMTNGTTTTQDPFDEGIPVTRIETISTGEINLDNTGIVPTDKGLEDFYLKKGDVLFSHINSFEYVANCAIFNLDIKLLHGMNLLRLVPNKSRIEPFYLLYLVKSDYFKKLTQSVCNRAINQVSISNSKLKNFKVVVPKSLIEQLAIANYLDHQTQKIDRLIANKKSQAEKLKELRQIEINNAVTKGLNPNAELKDSGIYWLGKIPKHWEVKRLKNCTTIISKGTTPSTMGEDLEETGTIKYIKAENIANNQVNKEPEFYITEETDEILFRSKLQEFDILIVIAGATIGKTAILQKEFLPANTNQAVCFIRLNRKRLSEVFLNFWLHTTMIEQQILLDAVVSAQPNLSMTDLSFFPIVIPSIEEQNQITEYLQERTNAIDNLIKNVNIQIGKLQEVRKIKIYEAVTGKIKVK